MKSMRERTSLIVAQEHCVGCSGEHDAEGRWMHDRACPFLTRRQRAALAASRITTEAQETE